MERSKVKEIQEAACKRKIANKAVLIEASGSMPEIKRKPPEEGEGSKGKVEEAVVKESVEENKTSISSIKEKMNLWKSKERATRRRSMEKARYKVAIKVIDVNSIEMSKERAKKEELNSSAECKSMEIEKNIINSQEVTSVIRREEEETKTHVSGESGEEKKSSEDDDETSKTEKQEASEEAMCLNPESQSFLNGFHEKDMEAVEDSIGDIEYDDWISEVSKPQSHWETLKKQRELEIENMYTDKYGIQNLMERRIVSKLLKSDLRRKIDLILISYAQKLLNGHRNRIEDEDSGERLVKCSTSYQEKLEENETEKLDLETVMMTWNLEDHEAEATVSSNPKVPENISSEKQMIHYLMEQIKQLQKEMIELKSFVNFQKSESGSVSDSQKRNCTVCFEMPIETLTYRCGHM